MVFNKSSLLSTEVTAALQMHGSKANVNSIMKNKTDFFIKSYPFLKYFIKHVFSAFYANIIWCQKKFYSKFATFEKN